MTRLQPDSTHHAAYRHNELRDSLVVRTNSDTSVDRTRLQWRALRRGPQLGTVNFGPPLLTFWAVYPRRNGCPFIEPTSQRFALSHFR